MALSTDISSTIVSEMRKRIDEEKFEDGPVMADADLLRKAVGEIELLNMKLSQNQNLINSLNDLIKRLESSNQELARDLMAYAEHNRSRR